MRAVLTLEGRFDSWCGAVFVKGRFGQRPFWLTALGPFWQKAVLVHRKWGRFGRGPFWLDTKQSAKLQLMWVQQDFASD